MNIKFYVFGVPDGFDLYPNRGDANEIKYFQSFYDGSTEQTKLSVRRNADGRVSYSYLKYNLTSGGNRPGAFFGMSVVFESEYCDDFLSLYELFETVYQDILKQGILLKKLSDTQTRFTVYQLHQAEAEINRIENIIKVNLESSYSDDIKPIDTSFVQNTSNILLKINNEESNSYFLTALKQYANIAISPAYKKGIEEKEEQISQNVLDEIYVQIAAWESENKRFMFETENIKLKNLFEVRDRIKGDLQKLKEKEIERQYNTMIQQIRSLETKSNAILSTLQKHLRKFSKHAVLLELREYLNELHKTLSGQRNAVEVYRDLIAAFGTSEAGGKKRPKTESPIPDPSPNWFKAFWRKYKKLIAAGAGLAVLVVIGVLILINPFSGNNENSSPTTQAIKSKVNIDSLISIADTITVVSFEDYEKVKELLKDIPSDDNNDCKIDDGKTIEQYLKDIEEQNIHNGQYAKAISYCTSVQQSECATKIQKCLAGKLSDLANYKKNNQ